MQSIAGMSKVNMKKRRVSQKNKNRIWKAYDTMKISESSSSSSSDSKPDQELCHSGSFQVVNNDYSRDTYREYCDLCSSEVKLSEDNGFNVCSSPSCGKVYKDMLYEGAEWRFYNGEGTHDPTRCGMPINPLLRESSFGSKILLSGSKSYEMGRLKQLMEWGSMPYREKALYDDFKFIENMANNSKLDKRTIDKALMIHSEISKKRTFRALNRHGIIAASIYIACKQTQYPITPEETAEIFHLDKSSATKGCKNAMIILNQTESHLCPEDKTQLFQTKPISFIERYCSKLRINEELTNVCKFVCKKLEMNRIAPENQPHSKAAGVVYFISNKCNLNVSKRDVHQISGISEVTINKCFQKIEKYTNILIPSIILKKYQSSSIK